jgi:hypothetical protein
VSDFKSFEDLEKLFGLCEKHNVTKFKLGELEVELQPESKVVTLDELMGEPKDQPKRPKTPYEQALERAAGVPGDEAAQ